MIYNNTAVFIDNVSKNLRCTAICQAEFSGWDDAYERENGDKKRIAVTGGVVVETCGTWSLRPNSKTKLEEDAEELSASVCDRRATCTMRSLFSRLWCTSRVHNNTRLYLDNIFFILFQSAIIVVKINGIR